MIEVRKLVKTFGLKAVLRGMDFGVERGEFVAILGPNGAGKTTFLRILATLSRPNMGEVLIGGWRLPSQATEVRRLIGVVSHQPLLYGDLTAEENLRFYSRMYSLQHQDARVREVLEIVGLSTHGRELVRKFSRGMQQRLTIARAILHTPELLLFDEPHTGLDQDAAAMLDEILREVAGRGHTVVMTSHDLPRAVDLATRVDILSRGKIAASIQRGEVAPEDVPALYRSVTRG